MAKKTFDCIKSKRRGQELLRKKLAGMTPEQELAYWHEQTEAMRAEQRLVQERLTPERVEALRDFLRSGRARPKRAKTAS
jgi:hypothetical protein